MILYRVYGTTHEGEQSLWFGALNKARPVARELAEQVLKHEIVIVDKVHAPGRDEIAGLLNGDYTTCDVEEAYTCSGKANPSDIQHDEFCGCGAHPDEEEEDIFS